MRVIQYLKNPYHIGPEKKNKAWRIVDRDLFSAIEIVIGDRHFVKRSQDDRDREIQRSRSQKNAIFKAIANAVIF